MSFLFSLTEDSFCAGEFDTSPKAWIKNMEAPDVKVFYDWLYETHQKSIRALSVLHSYWRRLKMFYKRFNKRGIENFMVEDVLNYINWLGKEKWKLQVLPKEKLTGDKDDIYYILHTHWVQCLQAYTDKRQQLQVSIDILMGLFSQWLVSLFNTRMEKKSKAQEKGGIDKAKNSEAELEQGIDSSIKETEGEAVNTNCHFKVQAWLNSCADDRSATAGRRKRELDEEEPLRGQPVQQYCYFSQSTSFAG
ncbi:hypothetical protein AJ80_04821 [Polytolypa hystricis UAMH7299]|uniref:Uncharacterized protein n=1 Tax=Polytolypa hystricis (strain UAMH7299) TaxID=1447883 RepID=A0A2B7Y8R8_POLH7|nr:hypothetical protein AJ80_04821 [Polytolypa hystricis UAMH7299]